MTDKKPPTPAPQVAPEFSSRKSLAAILKPGLANSNANPAADDGLTWTIFGVSAIWRSAAENAARLSGEQLGQWMTATINAAATAQGIIVPNRSVS